MIRILIADSDAIAADSLKNTIQIYFGTLCKAVTVESGPTAVEKSRDFKPDIVIVDTRIAGLTWIQTIQEIREEHPLALFIITTSYNRYSYTNEAAILDVSEILTKPINRKEVLEVCNRTIRQVELRRMTRSDLLFLRGKLERAIPPIEDAFIGNLIRENNGNDNLRYLKLLGVPQESGCVAVLEFREKGKAPSSLNYGTASAKFSEDFEELRKTIIHHLPCLMSGVMGTRIILYVPTDFKDSFYDHKEELTAALQKLVRVLEDKYELRFRAGIGEIYRAEQGIFSYREALQCLNQKNKSVVHIKDYKPEEAEKAFPRELFSKCLHSALRGDKESPVQAFIDLCIWLEGTDFEIGEIETILLKLLFATEHRAAEEGLLQWERLRDDTVLARLRGTESPQYMRKWYMDQWIAICDDIAAMKKHSIETVSGKAIKYIQEHFTEEISLEDVAGAVNISPFYFSRLFKQETGKSFTEVLNETRIQKSKEYLSDPMFSIKEICRRCGYSDPNYFSRIFRKYEGMSPSEWRNANS